MYTLHTVLLPVDFYHDEAHALRHVRAFVPPASAEIVFLHVVNPNDSDAMVAEEQFQPERWFQRLIETGRTMGLNCRAEVVHGSPKDAIIEAAARTGVDCIAVSTGARFAVERLIQASVCMDLIHDSPVPVMAITPAMDAPPALSPADRLPRTIVSTVDESTGTDPLCVALGIALPIGATVIAIHPGSSMSPDLRAEVTEIFGRDEFKKVRGGITNTRRRTTTDIVNAARAVQADLLVMSAELHSDPAALATYTTTESVITICDCPVLALPAAVHARLA